MKTLLTCTITDREDGSENNIEYSVIINDDQLEGVRLLYHGAELSRLLSSALKDFAREILDAEHGTDTD